MRPQPQSEATRLDLLSNTMQPAKQANINKKKDPRKRFDNRAGCISATVSRGNEVHDSKQGNRTDIEKKWENDEQKTIILSPSHLAHEGEEGTGAGTGKRAIARSKNQSNF